jgi:hypothetical protein
MQLNFEFFQSDKCEFVFLRHDIRCAFLENIIRGFLMFNKPCITVNYALYVNCVYYCVCSDCCVFRTLA